MKTPRTIRLHDVARIPANEVQPGMITANGIVVAVRFTPKGGGVFFDFDHSTTTYAEVGDPIQVYAQLTPEMTETFIAAVSKQKEH